MSKLVYVVKIGKSYHPWNKCKIVYEGKDKEDCENWLRENLKMNEHGYIQQVEKVRLKK